MSCELSAEMDKDELFKKIKLFLFDMDGTLYIGDRLFDFTPRLLETIKQNGEDICFLPTIPRKA